MSALEQIPVVILAGGLATRLRPVTERIPKALVPVAGEPFLAHQLRLLRSHGFRSVVLCIGHLGEMIEEAFGDGSSWGMRIQYSYDGPVLLRTGGALVKALPMAGPTWFLLYGDSYLRIDYAAVYETYRAGGKPALMTVLENRNAWDRSNVLFEDGRILRYDKHAPTPEMHHIDYGLGIFDSSVFAGRKQEPFDLSDVQTDLVARGEMTGYLATERFFEIGSPAGLQELETFLNPTLSR